MAQSKRSGDQAADSLSVGTRTSMAVTVGAMLISMMLTWLIARAIVRPLRSAVDMAHEVASGNLRSRSTQAGHDETGQVLLTLDKVTQRLNVLMAEIRGGADQIDIAVGEVSMGRSDLANRTEETVVAIQATSSSIAQLTSTIELNSQTAVQANQLATEATKVAGQGGVAVTEVVTTMNAVSVQASRISEIIGTIDSIAFQTNILALNAAVEAARAGEQGRGFAVVASEVRVLAQSSAAASKEIRTLIGASVEQVESGILKVHAAGETMRRIVEAIERVSTMVAAISRATSEQADSIHRVNDSVSDIERNTQQNAALVEQSAGASDSLRVQSAGLVQAVSFFRTT